jgi:hypothetical protein
MQQNLAMQSLLPDSSGIDSQVNMSGMSDGSFSLNCFICAGYRQISFEECQKYKILHFRHSCFSQPSDQPGNSWYKGVSTGNKPMPFFLWTDKMTHEIGK